MRFAITWILSLFKKPEVDITAWPFPAETLKTKPTVKKVTTRKPAAKKTVAKKTTKKVVKK